MENNEKILQTGYAESIFTPPLGLNIPGYFEERMLDEPTMQGYYSIAEEDISEIYVYWTAGSVDIARSDEDGISFSETSTVELLDEERLQYSVHDSVLVVSYSAEEEKDIVKLADILGHTSINTTRIYMMTTSGEHRNRMEQMHLII